MPEESTPAVVPRQPEAVATVVTAFVAARSKSLLFAMLAGVTTVWVLRHIWF